MATNTSPRTMNVNDWLAQATLLAEDAKASMTMALNTNDEDHSRQRCVEAQMLATLALAATTAAQAAAMRDA